MLCDVRRTSTRFVGHQSVPAHESNSRAASDCHAALAHEQHTDAQDIH